MGRQPEERLIRLLRLLKLARYSQSIQEFGYVFVKKREELVLAFGAGLFVLPIPGTFIGGALVLLAGVVARVLGA